MSKSKPSTEPDLIATDVNSKECTKCNVVKATSEFFRQARNRDGLFGACKVCVTATNQKWHDDNLDRYQETARRYAAAHREQRNTRQRAWYQVNARRVAELKRKSRLKARGLTATSYDALLENQKGVCAICGGPPLGRWGRFAVDHDHATGETRGLLCQNCNTGLGKFGDELDLLTKAVKYLASEARTRYTVNRNV